MVRSSVVMLPLLARRRGIRVLSNRGRRVHIDATAQPRILVVGGGPVGLAMGYLLDRVYGIPTRIIDRQAQPTTHPQAHFINLRTMEVLYSSMPEFHNKLLDNAAPSDLWRDYIYTTGVGKSREFARIDQFGNCIPRPLPNKHDLLDALDPISPTQFLHFPQNRFETMLSAFVQDAGLPIEREVELLDLQCTSGTDRPSVRLRNNRTQQVEHATFDYVIGADGAHSLVRQLSGIDMVGARNLQSIVNVHFTSKSLSTYAQEHPGMLYFVFNEHVIGVLIAHDLDHGEWVFQIPFFPPQESIEDDFSVEKCKQIVRHLLPPDAVVTDDDTSILSVGQWQMSARVATQYDSNHRVFLVGDAAHQFPPAGGFGMNTGIQDAHNLAWKLAWANQAGDTLPLSSATLLRSYERERQLIAKLNTQLSLRNVERTMKIPSALNVSHNNAKLLATVVNSAPVKYLPLALQREAIQAVMTLGKKPLSLLDAAGSALGERMRRHVRDIVAKRSSLGMLFYHFDIGYSYASTSWSNEARELMQDSVLDQSAAFTPEKTASDAVFTPEFRVGGRLPHFWCVDHTSGQRVSSVTLVDVARRQLDASAVKFVLIVDEQAWALERVNDPEVMKHITVVAVSNAIHVVESGDVDSQLRLQVDPASSTSSSLWKQFVASHKAVLVRPDGHIAALWTKNESNVVDADSLLAALRGSIDLV